MMGSGGTVQVVRRGANKNKRRKAREVFFENSCFLVFSPSRVGILLRVELLLENFLSFFLSFFIFEDPT